MFQVSEVAVYICTYNNLCLNLNVLCSIGKNVTFHSTTMQQPGTILDISKFTTQCVNTEYIVGQSSSCSQQDNEANKGKESHQMNSIVCGEFNSYPTNQTEKYFKHHSLFLIAFFLRYA